MWYSYYMRQATTGAAMEPNTTGTQIMRTRGRVVVKQHIDNVDLTTFDGARKQANKNALAALDQKFGMENWLIDSTVIDGTFFVTVAEPATPGTARRVFGN
jgi:hypothetical protein